MSYYIIGFEVSNASEASLLAILAAERAASCSSSN